MTFPKALRPWPAILMLFLLAPAVASAAIVTKWQPAPGDNWSLMGHLGYVTSSSVYDLLTRENSASGTKIGLRAAGTGALLAQTALPYAPNSLWLQDLDGDDTPEILVFDGLTGHCTCFNWPAAGSDSIGVRWKTTQVFGTGLQVAFVDFDGNGKHYVAFMKAGSDTFVVYDRNGVQAAFVTIVGAPNPTQYTSRLVAGPFDDGKAKEELWVEYAPKAAGSLVSNVWVYQSSTAVGVAPGTPGAGSLQLSASRPNPMRNATRIEYSVPTSGPTTLTLFDVSGREVRSLVNGPVTAGPHDVAWDGLDRQGRQVPAGTYFYELIAGGEHKTQRVVRVR
jgi:hypothetical protein